MQNSAMLAQLRLLHLADSALSIGSLAHSFGLETVVEEHQLKPQNLFAYLHNLLEETMHLEAVFCRAAHHRGCFALPCFDLNDRLDAMRVARESREASLLLGRRFTTLVADLETIDTLENCGSVHFSIAFGYCAGALGIEADDCIAAFLHQNVLSTISAAQRLMALGQRDANRIAWKLKPVILEAVRRSRIAPEETYCFAHLPELGSMRHPNLFTRLFIS